MKREIRTIDEKLGIIQITTVDERWYEKRNNDGESIFVPSVTWISSHYPKGIGFYKWLADKGWNEAEAIKQAAADKGSKVHQAIDVLLKNGSIRIDSKFIDPQTGEAQELTVEEYACVMSFADWHREYKPETVANETVIFNDEEGYAGTIDFICKIDGQLHIIDFKTSQHIWPEHELQISAYRHAFDKNAKTAILQLGYRLNKKKYKFTEIDDKYHLFLAAKKIWAEESSRVQPSQKDYPLEIRL